MAENPNLVASDSRFLNAEVVADRHAGAKGRTLGSEPIVATMFSPAQTTPPETAVMPAANLVRSLRPLLISVLVAVASLVLIALSGRTNTPAKAQTLQAVGPLKWYRGNLHTHSHWSDGDDYLESIALWYREHHYDFLGFTDHNVLADKERWIDVEKSKGKQIAFDKLRQKFPNGWVGLKSGPLPNAWRLG